MFCAAPDGDGARRALRQRIGDALHAHNLGHTASSECVRRALLVFEPPSLDAGETTDKGYVNQRRVLERRAPLVERLHASTPDADVLVFEPDGWR